MTRLPNRSAWTKRVGVAGVLGMAMVLLAGCGLLDEGESAPEQSPQTSETQQPIPQPEPALIPNGSAEDNLPFFTSIVAQVWQSEARAQGRAYIDALIAAGFDRAAMEVTPDESTVGNPAESLLFSVRWGEQCLIGQVGPETGEPVTTVAKVLEGDRCLVGQTRPIDW